MFIIPSLEMWVSLQLVYLTVQSISFGIWYNSVNFSWHHRTELNSCDTTWYLWTIDCQQTFMYPSLATAIKTLTSWTSCIRKPKCLTLNKELQSIYACNHFATQPTMRAFLKIRKSDLYLISKTTCISTNLAYCTKTYLIMKIFARVKSSYKRTKRPRNRKQVD